jgi:hypothetical protein
MNRRPVARGISVALLIACSAVGAAADPGWQKIDDSDGIVVYRREVPGSDVIAFKGEGVVNAPPVRVASVVFDTSRATEWIDSLVEARVVRRTSDTEYVEYDHFAMPFVIKDRDFVTLNRMEYDPARKTITIRLRSVSDPAAPATSHVRGTVISSTFVLTPTADGKATLVSGDVHCDPAGAIPKWLVNMFQKDWPHTTLQKLRAQVAKPNIVENAAVRRLVEQSAPSDPPR